MAKWVRFLRNRSVRVSPCRIIAYQAGNEAYLPDVKADKLILDHDAEEFSPEPPAAAPSRSRRKKSSAA